MYCLFNWAYFVFLCHMCQASIIYYCHEMFGPIAYYHLLYIIRVITGIFGQWGIFGHFSFSFLTQMRFSDINQALIIQNNQSNTCLQLAVYLL